MKILEKVLAVIAVLAIVLKIIRFPGGDLLLIISLCILAILYYPFGFALLNGIRLRHIFKKKAYTALPKSVIPQSVLFGMGLASLCMGILFRWLGLPGVLFMLIVGLGFSIVSAVFSIIQKRSKEAFLYGFFLKRAAILGTMGLIMVFVSSLDIVKFQFRNHPEYIQVYEAYYNDKGNEELRMKKDIEYNRIILDDVRFERYMEYELPQEYPELHKNNP